MAAQAPGLAAQHIANRSPALVIVSAVFLVITTLFFATRLIWRFKHQQRGWDDVMAACAYITLIVQTSFGFVAAHYGFGKHRADIPAALFSTAMYWFYLYQICYKLIGGFTKLNFCLLYLRIFKVKSFERIVWVVAALITAGTLAFTFGTIWQCVPVKRNWDKRVPGYCIDNMGFWFSHAAFNTFMDIVVFVLPIPVIRTLHMAQKQKTGLVAVFALGAFTIAASVVRMVMLRGSANSTQDPTWGSMPALIWTEIEANTAVICCCLPALSKLASQGWKRLRGQPMNSTPLPSMDAHSPGQTKTQKESQWKPMGNFSEAHHSPPGTPNGFPQQLHRSMSKVEQSGVQKLLQKLGHKKSASRSSSRDELAVAEEGHSPHLELGQIYKSHGVTITEDQRSGYQYRDPRQEMSLKEILNGY